MKRTEATVYVAFWISVSAMFIFGVRACAQASTATDIKNADIRNQQWLAQREDCNKHGGMLVPGWGLDWKCEGVK